MVFLWTDILLYIIAAVVAWAVYYISHNSQLKMQWQKSYQKPTRSIALVVLVVYVVIGLLDSIHYRTSAGVKSLLDWLLSPVGEQLETSYSQPFATQLFVEQLVVDPQGMPVWVSPMLEYVNTQPILPLLFRGILYGVLAWVSILAVLKLLSLRLNKSMLYTFGFMCILIAVCRVLMIQYHILGTDKVGNDVFYISIKSIRTGLVIGTVTTLVTLPFAIFFGAMAGYLRGWVDDIIQYVYTTLSSIPSVLLIAASMLSLDAAIGRHEGMFSLMVQRTDMRLLILCIILGVTSWTTLCRVIRAETLKLREYDYILAARIMGAGTMQIIIRHVVPNLVHIIIIATVLDFSALVLAEAVLSYVGVGVDPSTYSWGNMINSARTQLSQTPVIWWPLLGAFSFMFTLVLAANIFADGVRDAFDPRVT